MTTLHDAVDSARIVYANEITSPFRPRETVGGREFRAMAAALRAFIAACPVTEGMRAECEGAASVGIGKPVDQEAIDRVCRAMLAALGEEIA